MRALILLTLFLIPAHILAQETKSAEDFLLKKFTRGVHNTDELHSIDKVEVTGSMDEGFSVQVEYTSNCSGSKVEMEIFNRSVSGIFNYDLYHKKGYPLIRSSFVIKCRTRDRLGNYFTKPFARVSISGDAMNGINWNDDSTTVITIIAQLQEYTYL